MFDGSHKLYLIKILTAGALFTTLVDSAFSDNTPYPIRYHFFYLDGGSPATHQLDFGLSTIDSRYASSITPTIVSSGGTFTAYNYFGGLVHRNNQWGSGKADFLDIDPVTGVIHPSNSLAGVYDINLLYWRL